VKLVDVAKFNTILDDHARRHYEPATRTLWALAPEMMARKIAAANVQQSFMLAAVLVLAKDLPRSQLLSVGCYEDTAYEAIRQMAIPIRGIDPNVDGLDLSTFVKENANLLNTFDLVFSTSVIEHVEDDVSFAEHIASLLKPGGVAVLTCDFLNSWRLGDRVPPSDVRFYRSIDLRKRLPSAMPGCRLLDEPDWDEYEPDFDYAECRYSFATFTVIKGA
jgi:SAM-dependent methyltransferase